MAANTQPIYGLTPNIGTATITTASTNTSSAAGGTVATNTFLAFTPGANGSFIQFIRFYSVATATTTGVATVLRVFLSTVNTGSSTASNTFLLGEVSVPAIPSDHSTNATNYYDFQVNAAIPSTQYILVGQHTAQTANQNWIAVVFGSNY